MYTFLTVNILSIYILANVVSLHYFLYLTVKFSRFLPSAEESWSLLENMWNIYIQNTAKFSSFITKNCRELRETREIGREDCFTFIINRNPPIDQP